ncbi:uncharacterized protein BBA_01839 [Beauveria bassiana ARSEF 2860]|uniref:Cell wall galactomannoprotein n=1 Tax=Beauveria bassiana (strain ARSEF 2860) TaxID=655819 RepID=J4KQ93_BEAB2|nr:uncharacterized protein BBA_01839 [Beauveria bassiana ARSEF 2860]EJP68804.1 hypothetical protein BBA_01839 [Beauveria bassiana ARSEF 2860]
MKFSLVGIALVVATATADPHTINAIKDMMKETVAYRKSINEWNGSYMGGLLLLKQTRDLVNKMRAVEAATPKKRDIEQQPSPEMTAMLVKEGFGNAHELVGEIGASVDDAIAKKQQFHAIPVVGKRMALSNMESLRSAASDLSKVFAAAGDDEGRAEETANLLSVMDKHFERGIAAMKDEL